MAAQLSGKFLIERGRLRELVELRLREAQTLLDAELYVGAIYLAGYAVECELKHSICVVLDWSHLRTTFKTHDL